MIRKLSLGGESRGVRKFIASFFFSSLIAKMSLVSVLFCTKPQACHGITQL